jgi:hypothetical protein
MVQTRSMILIYDADHLIRSITPMLSNVCLKSYHPSCVTCSVVGTGFDPIGTCTSLVTVVPSSKVASISSRVQPLRRGIQTVQKYQYKIPNKMLYND